MKGKDGGRVEFHYKVVAKYKIKWMHFILKELKNSSRINFWNIFRLHDSDWQWQDKIIEAKDPVTSFFFDGNSRLQDFNEIK